MPAHCNPDLFDFAPVEDRSVVAAFDGGIDDLGRWRAALAPPIGRSG